MKTTNGGGLWTDQDVPARFYSIFFISPNTGWGVGYGGMIAKYNQTMVSVNESNYSLPEDYFLSQNYPNPFNPVTHLEISIPLAPRRGKPGMVSLKIYDMLGKEVATIVNENLGPGKYTYMFDGNNFSSGIYFYKLESGGFIQTKHMILLK